MADWTSRELENLQISQIADYSHNADWSAFGIMLGRLLLLFQIILTLMPREYNHLYSPNMVDK